jgi:hypothetical protein
MGGVLVQHVIERMRERMGKNYSLAELRDKILEGKATRVPTRFSHCEGFDREMWIVPMAEDVAVRVIFSRSALRVITVLPALENEVLEREARHKTNLNDRKKTRKGFFRDLKDTDEEETETE